MTFRNRRLRDHTLPGSTAWLLNDFAEAKGKQELFTHQSPQVLNALREAAIIQSTKSFRVFSRLLLDHATATELLK